MMALLNIEGSLKMTGVCINHRDHCIYFLLFRYGDFHKNQCEVVTHYPDMVKEELTRYDEAICKYFSVDWIHPDVRIVILVSMLPGW